jgi:hypothetical protein
MYLSIVSIIPASTPVLNTVHMKVGSDDGLFKFKVTSGRLWVAEWEIQARQSYAGSATLAAHWLSIELKVVADEYDSSSSLLLIWRASC